ELNLYMNYLREQLADKAAIEQDAKKKKYISSFCNNLREGIQYYRNLTNAAAGGREAFDAALQKAEMELDVLLC
ncbi:MAG TPA: hypothetical protein VK173_02395, partial [Lacibacter sp.]|nr:hypothetical protein [Lacibacter sp.]